MTYESSTPFINASLAEHCLSVEFNRPDALNALRPEMLSEAARLVRQASDDGGKGDRTQRCRTRFLSGC